MNFGVTAKKQRALEERMKRCGLRETDLDEKFQKGSGPGGQKVNKASNCVLLAHKPSDLEVKCQQGRSQSINRYYARKRMCQLIEEKLKGKKSPELKKREKIRKQKQRRKRRRRKKAINKEEPAPRREQKMSKYPHMKWELPDWFDEYHASISGLFENDRQKMEVLIELAEQNIEFATGGPFAAAVFDMDSGKMVVPGVNLVTSLNCSAAHAEMVAIVIAQKILQNYDFSQTGNYELVTTAEPCLMCLGLVHWSGIKRLVCGVGDAEVRKIGFDEGFKPPDWQTQLEKQGTEVIEGVLDLKVVEMMKYYIEKNGQIYNSSLTRGQRT